MTFKTGGPKKFREKKKSSQKNERAKVTENSVDEVFFLIFWNI